MMVYLKNLPYLLLEYSQPPPQSGRTVVVMVKELTLLVTGILPTTSSVCLFVLRFYGPVNPMGSCPARSVYLTTRLPGRLSPLSG